MFDVAIIGAGVAGLTVAQQLRQAGYGVVVVEKSRGVGGRVATRRLHNICADHGLRYLEGKGELLQRLVKILCDRQILKLWTDTIYQFSPDSQLSTTCYVAPEGMSAVAKFLAKGLEIWLNHRVESIILNNQDSWQLNFAAINDELPKSLTAKAVVMAIPAPQALVLLEPLVSEEVLARFRAIEFDPCITVMAGYSNSLQVDRPEKAILFSQNDDLAWIGLDSSKRFNPEASVFVIQSSAKFAQLYLDTEDLQPAARELLASAAKHFIPWLDTPTFFQVHRWRYAFPIRPLSEMFLDVQTSLPLICCGDWCGGNLVESALQSGLSTAQRINSQLQNLSLPGDNFFDSL
ncbi:FAD-dependent oxidoreductase [Phormidium sp. LEGE 05292]|uniref:NAD(P)/FAD-dependent oxidoreductase n=1 Tax=[Phormidium] sp. LEGE 05292 TaxID=767427 RepID=UPI001880A6F0|nr:FAD-dependent oxidoreductase [Phormidium sp. LEGE 05292]MBE9227116.1 FAD-dependent oxidoreductase [Phormidium sp. LEGE 05292]